MHLMVGRLTWFADVVFGVLVTRCSFPKCEGDACNSSDFQPAHFVCSFASAYAFLEEAGISACSRKLVVQCCQKKPCWVKWAGCGCLPLSFTCVAHAVCVSRHCPHRSLQFLGNFHNK